MNVHLTLKSANAKTGPIPVSTSSSATCPEACPFQSKGCYAKGGPLALHWAKVSSGERGTDWAGFTAAISALPEGQFWRHNQAGDLPVSGGTVDPVALGELVAQLTGVHHFDLGASVTFYFSPAQVYAFDAQGLLLQAPVRGKGR